MNSVAEKIRRAIEAGGPISCARFMEMALYSPGDGYYERRRPIGSGGDFYTSVSVGPLFGELLAFQFSQWLRDDGFPGVSQPKSNVALPSWQIVESGAHDGRLAADVLRALRSSQPEISCRVEYWILEPSATQRQWQQETLDEFAGQVRWFDSWSSIPRGGIHGIIFSNELLDAMPVHRVGWSAVGGTWFEWRVNWKGERFVWERQTLVSNAGFDPPRLPAGLLEMLPDQFTTEISPPAGEWWRNAALALRKGRLVTVDYGLKSEEFFLPQRRQGTLRACFQHQWNDDLLAHPGEQDLTAHVDFTALQAVGESAGLRTATFVSQSAFLTAIAAQTWERPDAFPEWTAPRKKQFQTLTHPEHLGRSFRVLVQTR